MARILRVFLEEPGKPRYGFELIRLTGLASGSLYPMLAKLEEAGWLAGIREEIDPKAAGRPRRVNYVLTGEGDTAARARLTALSELYRPPAVRSRTAARARCGTAKSPR